ncbi:MAG: hypothetical protein J7497_14580, partial [Chitinophagaceae bacterium]|nr:hypothetical protein [Chitinophagaceae bacterium]
MGLFSTLFGCKSNNSNAQRANVSGNNRLEDITSRIDPAEGWSDIFLKIISDSKTETSHIYIAKGLY